MKVLIIVEEIQGSTVLVIEQLPEENKFLNHKLNNKMLTKTNIDLSKAKKSSPIIARGESGNHCHVICGDADVVELNNEKYIIVRDAKLRHLLESEFNAGKEVWTKEHHDIKLEPGTYKYVPQVEYDPYNEVIRQVRD